jgi:hypothetical protein
MTRVAFVALLFGACGSDKPARPDEAKFRAMSDDEKCRATASRAIQCTDEILVSQVRSIPGIDGDLAGAMESDLADDKRSPKEDRKQNIQIHKTSCIAEPGYADAVFACWSITGCKQFAACLSEKSAIKPSRNTDVPIRDDGTLPSDDDDALPRDEDGSSTTDNRDAAPTGTPAKSKGKRAPATTSPAKP